MKKTIRFAFLPIFKESYWVYLEKLLINHSKNIFIQFFLGNIKSPQKEIFL